MQSDTTPHERADRVPASPSPVREPSCHTSPPDITSVPPCPRQRLRRRQPDADRGKGFRRTAPVVLLATSRTIDGRSARIRTTPSRGCCPRLATAGASTGDIPSQLPARRASPCPGTGNPYAGEVMNPEALVAMPRLVPDEYFRDAVRILAPGLFRTRTLLRRYAKTNLATSGA